MSKNIETQKTKNERIMEVVGWRAGYYRCNPSKFCEDYLGITNLKLFQKILLWCMMCYDKFYYIASRSQGKTYLVALFAVIRAILYPGEQIVCVSYTFKQGREIVMKIVNDFMHKSQMLCSEIDSYSTSAGQNDCGVWFKNGSYILVKIANENTRGARSTIIITDESRMIKQQIVDTILRPMNVSRRPGYLDKDEYKHLQEMPKEMYMSSAWYRSSEMFEKVKDYTANLLDERKNYFICALPYQLSIAEGLMMRQLIEDEMNEATFSDISHMMEREAIFYGASADALFDFDVIDRCRNIEDSFYELEFYRETSNILPKKNPNEYRILSLDIALLASKKHRNDASCFMLNQCFCADDTNYTSNYVYVDTMEGLTTEELGLITMRYFYQYDCDYLAIDANGRDAAFISDYD